MAPAIGNALYKATGVRLYHLPLTPERVWHALQTKKQGANRANDFGAQGISGDRRRITAL